MKETFSPRRTLLRGTLAAACGLWLPLSLGQSAAGKPDPASTETLREFIDWERLERLRIVFGHQSVGNDILNGVESLAARDKARISLYQRRTGPALPGINHFMIGRNGDPLSKILDFTEALDGGTAQGADVALMKLCYADFAAGTDARRVAHDYISHLEALASRHAKTTFIAVTSPLWVAQTGPGAMLKRLLNGGNSAQEKRNEFNALLRIHYATKGQLFDLARLESGANGQLIESLRPELTHDGGHLNERGQVLVAGAFLRCLSNLDAGRQAVF